MLQDFTALVAHKGISVTANGVGGSSLTEQYGRLLIDPSSWGKLLIVMDGQIEVTAEQAIAALQNMAALLCHDRWLYLQSVMSVPFTIGSPERIAHDANDALIATAIGDHYVETYQALADANDGSPQDLADVAAGIFPTSLRLDDYHLNDAGKAVYAQCALQRATELGWYPPPANPAVR